MPHNRQAKSQVEQLKQVFNRCHPRLFRYLLKRLKNQSDAHDLSQECFLRLMRVDKPELIRQPEAYLFRVASNLAYELTLSEKNRGPMLDIDDFEHSMESGEYSAERQLELEQRLQKLERIMDTLPPLYKATLLLCKRDGLSHQEIADKLNLSIHTVRKYIVRAVAHCRTADWKETRP